MADERLLWSYVTSVKFNAWVWLNVITVTMATHAKPKCFQLLYVDKRHFMNSLKPDLKGQES